MKGQTRLCRADTPSCQTSATSADAHPPPLLPQRSSARPARSRWGRAAHTCSKLFELNSLALRLRIPARCEYSPLPRTRTFSECMKCSLEAATPAPISSFHFDLLHAGTHQGLLLSSVICLVAAPVICRAPNTAPLPASSSVLDLDLINFPAPMLATATFHDPTMRDLEQELRGTLAALHDSNGEPLDGLHVLTRRMDNEEEEQFDVDLTILDFLVYKAIGLVFEWKSSPDPFHSDLPSALVTMTGGRTGPPLAMSKIGPLTS